VSRTIVITGGAGFVGGNLAITLKDRYPASQIIAFDNLKRRGSELQLSRLKVAGVSFVHGDIRSASDLSELPPMDVLIDAAAEPSVLAGVNGSPKYVLDTNYGGAANSLELCRERSAAFMLLSTSRVLPYQRLNDLLWQETPTRFVWQPSNSVVGYSAAGVDEAFSLEGPRSFYGTSKLCAELLIQEYVAAGIPAIATRFGVIAGPWQMGKVDQGVVSLWVARHLFGQQIKYCGFGGTGKQVRDILHIDDVADLVYHQLENMHLWDGRVFHAGGGATCSTSLVELTALCEEACGTKLKVHSDPDTHLVDVRILQMNSARVSQTFGWSPKKSMRDIVNDIAIWMREYRTLLEPILNS
jgi:CDP-paratose 2-epimerase